MAKENIDGKELDKNQKTDFEVPQNTSSTTEKVSTEITKRVEDISSPKEQNFEIDQNTRELLNYFKDEAIKNTYGKLEKLNGRFISIDKIDAALRSLKETDGIEACIPKDEIERLKSLLPVEIPKESLDAANKYGDLTYKKNSFFIMQLPAKIVINNEEKPCTIRNIVNLIDEFRFHDDRRRSLIDGFPDEMLDKKIVDSGRGSELKVYSTDCIGYIEKGRSYHSYDKGRNVKDPDLPLYTMEDAFEYKNRINDRLEILERFDMKADGLSEDFILAMLLRYITYKRTLRIPLRLDNATNEKGWPLLLYFDKYSIFLVDHKPTDTEFRGQPIGDGISGYLIKNEEDFKKIGKKL